MSKVKQLQPNAEQVLKEDYSKSKELIEREEIKDSPFTLISVDGLHFGAMGQHRITEKFRDKVALRKDLKKFTWNRLIQVMMILQDRFKLFEEEKEKINQNINKKNK